MEVNTYGVVPLDCRPNIESSPYLGRRRRAHFPGEIPHGLVGEMDHEVPVAACPELSLVEEIPPSEEHHVSGAETDLQFQLRKFEVSTFKVSEVEDACPSPVRIGSVTVGERESIEYNLSPFMDQILIQRCQGDLTLEPLQSEVAHLLEKTVLFWVNQL